jgi:hypothetical protein
MKTNRTSRLSLESFKKRQQRIFKEIKPKTTPQAIGMTPFEFLKTSSQYRFEFNQSVERNFKETKTSFEYYF